MSDTASRYASYILNKYFGEAATVSTHILCVKGASSLLEILKDSHIKLNSAKVCKCLISLIRHSMLTIRQEEVLKYSLNYERIFYIPRLPLFCKLVFHYYGKVAEQAMIYFSMVGRASLSDLLVYCVKKHLRRKLSLEEQHSYVEALGTTVTTLVKTSVLQIVNPKGWSAECNKETSASTVSSRPAEPSANVTVPESELQISKDEICEALHTYIASGFVNWPIVSERNREPSRKRVKRYDESSESLKLTVCLNIQTLETMWRDRLICQLASEKLGETCGDILSHLLCIATAANRGTGITSPESGIVSRSELLRSMRTVPDHVSSYISLLTDDEVKFLLQQPGLAVENLKFFPSLPKTYKHVIKQLFIKNVEYIIQVLFESNGLRIFRYLLLAGPSNLEEIERKVLLPQSDFRRILPRLELSRTKEYTADTIFCLYSVNLLQVARLVIELSQYEVFRISLRRDYEFSQKSRLIEQRYRIESLILQHQTKLNECTETSSSASLNDLNDSESQHKESVESLKSSITPAELHQLTVLSNKLSKLVICEYKCHTAWFVADLFLRLHS
ncbi:DNA-directed RNA polymerase III subunit RPC3 [Schistosoma japonicum]|nr:DNA-directed RNA polymerase III subunit RPC3 [Schistosoma japonicum]KAH8861000.1 DNA-directed RNA polymerase III subunit RPC3 [Schistosoma japonicum]